MYILIGLHHPSEMFFPPIHKSKALLKIFTYASETAMDGPVPYREYSGWPNIVYALGFMNLSTMDPLAFPRTLSNVVINDVSKLSMINANGQVPSQLSLCCALGEQILVPSPYLYEALLLYLVNFSLSVVLGGP